MEPQSLFPTAINNQCSFGTFFLTQWTTQKYSEIITCLNYYCRPAFVWCHLWTGWFLWIPSVDTVLKTGIWISLCKNGTNTVNSMNGCTVALLAKSHYASPYQNLLCSSVETTHKCVFSLIKHFKPLIWQTDLYNPIAGENCNCNTKLIPAKSWCPKANLFLPGLYQLSSEKILPVLPRFSPQLSCCNSIITVTTSTVILPAAERHQNAQEWSIKWGEMIYWWKTELIF